VVPLFRQVAPVCLVSVVQAFSAAAVIKSIGEKVMRADVFPPYREKT